MDVRISNSTGEMARRAATDGGDALRRALRAREEPCIVLATGASQFEMLEALVEMNDIDWSRVTAFHLDEYIGISADHPASFRRYLRERFAERLPVPLRTFHFINPDDDPDVEIRHLNAAIEAHTVDVAFIGIGENGHLAFNDPPADFETTQPYLRVSLDERCRMQQMGEGWFERIDDVPAEAISMSIHQIMQARDIICTVPDARKAEAVQLAVAGPITPDVPASMLQRHPSCRLYLDCASAELLDHHGS